MHNNLAIIIIKKSFLDPKCGKFYKKSEFGHVRTCQGQSRRTSPCQLGGFLLFLSEITPFPFLLTNLLFLSKVIILKSVNLFSKTYDCIKDHELAV